jgi:hypothetical protein
MAGLLHPKNAQESSNFAFKEGFVKVVNSSFKVIQPREPKEKKKDYIARSPFTALVWDVNRLDENLEPLTDEHDNPLTESIEFSLGSKGITNWHPGKGDTPDDTDIEDQGVKPGAEGNTIFIVNASAAINSNSGISALSTSLLGKVEELFLNREWAPDWIGGVFYMKGIQVKSGEGDGAFTYTQKIVDKVVSLGKKTAQGTVSGKPEAAASKPDDAAEKAIQPIMEALSAELDGTKVGFKTLVNRVSTALKNNNVDAKLHVPVLALVKDVAWLKKNTGLFDMATDVEAKTVVFGTLKD